MSRGPYRPIRDAIAPASKGDGVRHVVVRTAFMNALFGDAGFVALRREWAERAGLLPRMRALHDAWRTLAAQDLPGPVPWGIRADELLAFLPDPDGSGLPRAPRLARAMSALREADRALVDRMRAVSGDPQQAARLLRDISDFVRRSGTPWPWLVEEIVTGLAYWVEAPRRYQARPVLERSALPGPGFAGIPRGTFPEKQVAILERDALWFYRVRVRGDAWLAVARDAFPEDEARARRRDIKEGVRRAEQLLARGFSRFA